MIGSVFIGPVLAVCVGLALAAWFGPGSRTRLTLAWMAMIGFAGLASYTFWRGTELRRSAVPVFYDLPAAPGSQRVTIRRPGVAPGYRLQLVDREGVNLSDAAVSKLSRCDWTVSTCEHLKYRVWHPFERESVLEMESEWSEIVLVYQVSIETGPLLADVTVKAVCPTEFRRFIEQGWSSARFFTGVFMGGLFFAAFGARAQRRKLRRAAVRAPAPSTSGPPAP